MSSCRGLCNKFDKKRNSSNAYCRSCQKFSKKSLKNTCLCCNSKLRLKPRGSKKRKKESKKEKN